jgi:hypothetical protein
MSEFIDQQKKLYKSLTPVFCPALQATVHFNADGLNPLLYVRRRPRSHDERHYRLALIAAVSEVIASATQTTKEVKSEMPLTVLWSLQHHIQGEGHITVVLRQIGAGRVHFLSVMKRKTKGPKRSA